MILSRTHSTLQSAAQKTTVTIEDILMLFNDIYEDVKSDTGTVLEQQEIGNEEEVVSLLCWLARMTARIYRKNEAGLCSAEAGSRWDNAEKKLSEAEARLEAVKAEWSVLQEKTEKVTGELEEKEAAVRQALEKQKETGAKAEALAGQQELLKEQESKEEQRKKELEEALETTAGSLARLREETSVLEAEYRQKAHLLREKLSLLGEAWGCFDADRILAEGGKMDETVFSELRESCRQSFALAEKDVQDFCGYYRKLLQVMDAE